MKNNLTPYSQIQPSSGSYIDRTVKINGIDFEEQFISKLIADHMKNPNNTQKPTITTAFEIYKKESPASAQRKFQIDLNRNFNIFLTIFGDVLLEDLRHANIAGDSLYQGEQYVLCIPLAISTVPSC